jgi:hypothetical protein
VRRASFVLAMGVAFAAVNMGVAISQEECLRGDTVQEADSPVFGRPICTIEGDENDNVLEGTNDTRVVDKMLGHGGKDTLSGHLGYDGMAGGAGEDTLDGGMHPDGLWGDEGTDQLNGGRGNDLIIGIEAPPAPPERDVISCGSGKRDYVEADRNIDKVAKDCERIVYKPPDVKHWWKRVMGRD